MCYEMIGGAHWSPIRCLYPAQARYGAWLILFLAFSERELSE
jgi:hypothetical protein